MTEYVVTRWYRAPELLLRSTYSYPIDVWSVGCILVEMFTRVALFPGQDHVHQLQLIIELVGCPSMDELSTFITNESAKRWMIKQSFFKQQRLRTTTTTTTTKKISETESFWSTIAPTAPPEATDLMSKLLVFDPRARLTIDEALNHPFLRPYRDGRSEGLADTPFDFSFEKDLGSGSDGKERHHVSLSSPSSVAAEDIQTLQRLIFEDICYFHPEAQEELVQLEPIRM